MLFFTIAIDIPVMAIKFVLTAYNSIQTDSRKIKQ